ncbi:MAG: type II secretion system secretin GspD [Pseudomonadota bacterium]
MTSTFKPKLSGRVAFALAGGMMLPFTVAAQSLGPSDAVIAQASLDNRHIMNLQDVEISVLIDDVSSITGYTFIVHPSVRGQVSVSSQAALTTREVFDVFLSTLRVNGFAAVPAAGGAYKIVPENTARADAGLASRAVAGDQFETAVLTLENFDVVEAARMIKPIIDPQGQVTASANSDKLIVVDYASNLPRIRSVIAEIDKDRSIIRTLGLQNVSSGEMAKMVNALTAGSSNSFNFDVGAVAMESGNTIVLRGEAADVARVAQIVAELDDQSRPSEDSLKVLSINHGNASDLEPIISGLALSMTEASSVGNGATTPTVAVHAPTNSLIVSASPPVLREIERVVEDLDVRRSQVLVEAIVVELSDSATRELGLQFVVGGADDTPIAVTNFSNVSPNILGLAGALLTDNIDGGTSNTNLTTSALAQLSGVNGGLFGFGTQNADGDIFGAIINAVAGDTDSSILSTPSVMALDNETASFLSGQEIPITTGEALGDNNANPFRTVERQDVGVQLEVTPQISDEETVRLAIRQEVSSVFGAVTTTSGDLITNKREVSTTILADDGDIIVLGGLIQEDENISVTKVPLLGDIPVLGRAFRSEGKSTSRTNLMVFMRPTIVRDQSDVRSVTDRKYTYIRDQQIEFSPTGESSLDEIVARVLGEQR